MTVTIGRSLQALIRDFFLQHLTIERNARTTPPIAATWASELDLIVFVRRLNLESIFLTFFEASSLTDTFASTSNRLRGIARPL